MKALFTLFLHITEGVKEAFKTLFLIMLLCCIPFENNQIGCGFAYIEHLQKLRNVQAPKIPSSFLACENAIEILKKAENKQKGIKSKTYAYTYSLFRVNPEFSHRDTLLTNVTIQQKMWQSHRARISRILYNN